MKKIYILYFTFCVFNSAFGQTNTFLQIYNVFGHPKSGTSVIQTYDGNYLLTVIGPAQSILAKADTSSAIIIADIHTLCGQNPRSIIQSNDSNYFFVSTSFSGCMPSNNLDLILTKANKNGDTLWTKVVVNTSYQEGGMTISKLHDGNFIIGGGGSGPNLWKIDSLGNLIWSMPVWQNVEYVESIIEDNDSNLIVAGSCNGGDGWAIAKLNFAADSVLWVTKNTTNSGNGSETVKSVLELDNGNYFVAGHYSQLFNCGLAILERNTGNILWSDSLQGGLSADFTADGNIIIAADSFIMGILTVIDQGGNFLWRKVYTAIPGYMYEFRYVKTALDGGFMVTGDRWHEAIGDFNSPIPILLKTDSLGNYSWTTEINELTKSEDYNFYPNPLSIQSKLTFKNPNKEKFLFTLYDITGRITESVSTTNNEIILTKSSKTPDSYREGVYLFNLLNKKTGERWNGEIVISN